MTTSVNLIRLQAALGILLALCFCPAAFTQQDATGDVPAVKSQAVSPILISDGTMVHLRFAQPVTSSNYGKSAKKGDTVRLVVAADVRAGGAVVIAKGSLAQATIMMVVKPAWGANKSTQTGITLRLDWASSVTGVEVPLRASEKPPARAFDVEVLATKEGIIARPRNFRREMVGALTGSSMFSMFSQRNWIPAGTRLTTYVEGNVSLDAAEVQQAQDKLPEPNPNSLVSIYRPKGEGKSVLPIFCDGRKLGDLGELQYVTVELVPGKHACRAENIKAADLDTKAGEDYYLRLSHKFGGWELKLVTGPEGEDGVAAAEAITPQQ